MGSQQSNDTTKKPQGAGPEQATDAVMAFYIECANLAGVELSEWLDSEPF